jgi:hypothetical protein
MSEQKTDFQIAWELSQTKDKPFFVDTIKKLLNAYDGEEISFSKFVEELNVSAWKWRGLPENSGDRDCEELKKEVEYKTNYYEDKCEMMRRIQIENEQRISELEKEVERLKGLIDEAYKTGWFDSPEEEGDTKTCKEGLEDFKTENNL